jgi:hypothetical protein
MNMPIEKRTAAAVTAEATSCPFASARLFSKGVERLIEASKTSLDLAVELNADLLASCKQALNASSIAGSFLFDLADTALEGYVTIQMRLLDLTLEQNTAQGEAAHAYSHDAGEAKSGVAKAIEQSVDHTEAAQRTVLDLAKEVICTVKQQ